MVQCIDFSPITQEPGVPFYAGDKRSVTSAEQKAIGAELT